MNCPRCECYVGDWESVEEANEKLLEACKAILRAERLDWGSDPGLASARAAGLARKAIAFAEEVDAIRDVYFRLGLATCCLVML